MAHPVGGEAVVGGDGAVGGAEVVTGGETVVPEGLLGHSDVPVVDLTQPMTSGRLS